ncbi:MAG: hypothetical protein ACMUIP_18210 [bacterium]
MALEPHRESSNRLFGWFKKDKNKLPNSAYDVLVAYRMRVAQIIRHDTFYKGFNDKLPSPEYLAGHALYCYARNRMDSEARKSSHMARNLLDFIKNYITWSIHQGLKTICQDVYQGMPGSEEKLKDYRINVLALTRDIFSADFVFDNYTGLAQQVMSEFISRVRQNGIKDKMGQDIDNLAIYIYEMIRTRMSN